MHQLFEEFDISSPEAWKQRLEKDLKGITFEQLSSENFNNLSILPFYTLQDLPQQVMPTFQHQNWDIVSDIKVGNPSKANLLALEQLNGGASGLKFTLGADCNLEVLLKDIQLPYIHTSFKVIGNIEIFDAFYYQYIEQKNMDRHQLNSLLVFDPIGDSVAHDSTMKYNWQEQYLTHNLKTGGAINIEADIYQNAGANSVYQLALILSHLNEYLHVHQQQNKLHDIHQINISLSVGTDFFEEISKLRALRYLFKFLTTQYQVKAELNIHATTSNIYRSHLDKYNNMLRDTLAAMAAILGGANSVSILPFDAITQDSNDFSRRMARNIQLILKEESYLHRIADAAHGSYFIEQQTQQIEQAAWEVFKSIETDGGFLAALQNNSIQERVTEQATQRINAYKDGKKTLIGVNKYPNPKDEEVAPIILQTNNKGLLRPINLAAELTGLVQR